MIYNRLDLAKKRRIKFWKMLQSGKPLFIDELAEEFNCSAHSIHMDKKELLKKHGNIKHGRIGDRWYYIYDIPETSDVPCRQKIDKCTGRACYHKYNCSAVIRKYGHPFTGYDNLEQIARMDSGPSLKQGAI